MARERQTARRTVGGALAISLLGISGLLGGCAHSEPVHQQAYAKLPDHRVFEFDMRTTWIGIELAFKDYRVTRRDPDELPDGGADAGWRKLTERKLETDWIYGQSRDKFIEYRVNDTPRKTYLQTRVKYALDVKSVLGGTDVRVKTTEEIEGLRPNGTSAGWSAADRLDPSRADEVLNRIQQGILSSAP